VRAAAAASLGTIGRTARPALMRLHNGLRDPSAAVRIQAALAQWRIAGDTSGLDVILRALADDDPGTRESACRALVPFGPAAGPATPALAHLLSDKDARVRQVAVEALGAVGKDAAAARPDVERLLKDEEPPVRLAAGLTHWRLSGETKAALDALSAGLEASNPALQKRAAELLAVMGPAAAARLPMLVQLYREQDDGPVRQAFAHAIRAIDAKAAALLGISAPAPSR
jgi:HEAT repeat protein